MYEQIANSDSHLQGLLKVICSNDVYLPYSHAGGLGPRRRWSTRTNMTLSHFLLSNLIKVLSTSTPC